MTPPPVLLEIARSAVRCRLQGSQVQLPTLQQPWVASRGVFVTWRRRDGALRGCIGHLGPSRDLLSEEIADVAVAAALRDSRFVPVESVPELDVLICELSLMTLPELGVGALALDPGKYGVIVRSGGRRGVLLPALPGVETVEQQLSIACRKAGIAEGEPVEIDRFEVLKLAETQ